MFFAEGIPDSLPMIFTGAYDGLWKNGSGTMGRERHKQKETGRGTGGGKDEGEDDEK